MSVNAIDAILGRKNDPVAGKAAEDASAVQSELLAEAAEPDAYRPYIIRARPQLGFTLIENDGTRHGFQYHALRHPKWQRRNGEEFMSFTADGLAVVMQGRGLTILHAALVRGTLAEVREHDGKQPVSADTTTQIDRLEVQDAEERAAAQSPRLVK
ncbi:hypothetical protein ACFQY5_35980 [Paeniroseomonas aquatica]|uniref:Uncharacterized protein n=1 Tax=Paeniroseomonas aquatica TaxID=373043 RepID=A0ABT8AGH0_9PROT|nr:hypothetical protein [Paeniroseomonas aquatica]MDN3568715.1 hypothetical protein [Paeniroseomonas aquatica]